jgi:hypothetical protein
LEDYTAAESEAEAEEENRWLIEAVYGKAD